MYFMHSSETGMLLYKVIEHFLIQLALFYKMSCISRPYPSFSFPSFLKTTRHTETSCGLAVFLCYRIFLSIPSLLTETDIIISNLVLPPHQAPFLRPQFITLIVSRWATLGPFISHHCRASYKGNQPPPPHAIRFWLLIHSLPVLKSHTS